MKLKNDDERLLKKKLRQFDLNVKCSIQYINQYKRGMKKMMTDIDIHLQIKLKQYHSSSLVQRVCTNMELCENYIKKTNL